MPEKTKPKAAPIKRVDVVLKKSHTHAGKQMGKGDKINVTEAQVLWLKERKVI